MRLFGWMPCGKRGERKEWNKAQKVPLTGQPSELEEGGEEGEYVYEDELEEGDEYQYLAEEEEASLLALRERGPSSLPPSSSSSSSLSSLLSPEEEKEGLVRKEDKNTRFLVRGPDGRFVIPSSGRRLIPLNEKDEEENVVVVEEEEGGKEGGSEGGRKWRGLDVETRIPLRGPPGVIQYVNAKEGVREGGWE